ncbi:hypothetical protein [Psychroserpens algicola]|uniref:Uncharacterized protein n=1 Tax=Psychroserpens algicola TaxID=1719034 RepID=A0ABT0H8I5_9FLAO|nr:hypothetical protein [Psychroserpens algicola]MCK8480160.1 hypothetical protein [Psychroserpens algicola]
MSAVRYKKIFEIKITHAYFSTLIPEDLNILFGPITQDIIRRFDIQVKRTLSNCSFYMNSESSIIDFINHLDSELTQNYFDFYIEIKSPYFYNYTQINLDTQQSVLYESRSAENTFTETSVVLNPIRHHLSSTDKFAEVNIYFQDIIDAVDAEFVIAFESRATYWQYLIIDRSDFHLKQPHIKSDQDITFQPPKLVTTQHGVQAFEMISEVPLKLSQQHHYTFSLYDVITDNFESPNESSQGLKKIINSLPGANANLITLKEENGKQKFLSPIYIYI